MGKTPEGKSSSILFRCGYSYRLAKSEVKGTNKYHLYVDKEKYIMP